MATVETVRGPVEVGDLGPTLMHEHVFILSTEHVQNYGDGLWWDEEARVADAVSRLRALRGKGITTIVDPTVWGLGRYIPRIQRIAEQVELNIVVATGLYVYEELPHQYSYRGPGLLLDMPEPMVTDFTRDITEGIGTTGVKAAFLKCCVEAPGLTPGVERIARAVARTHVETGAPITVHTSGPAQSGRLAVDLFRKEGVDLTKVVIGHAGDSNDLDYLMALADSGATLGMDRFGLDLFNPTPDRVRTIAALAARGLRRPDGARPRRELLHRLVRGRSRRGQGGGRAELALHAHQRRRAPRAARRPGSPTRRSSRCWSTTRAATSAEVRHERAVRRSRGDPRPGRDQAVRRAARKPGPHAARRRRGPSRVARRSPRPAAVPGSPTANCGTAPRGWRAGSARPACSAATASRSGSATASTGSSAFFGTALAGGIVVPVNTRLTEAEAAFVVSDSGAAYVVAPGEPLPDGAAARDRRRGTRRPGGDLLHQRHDRLPQGRRDHARELPVELRELPADPEDEQRG